MWINKLGKLVRLFILLLIFSLLQNSNVFASGPTPPEDLVEKEETETAPLDPYDIELSFGTQSPWTNRIPLTIRIKPNIDSSRTEIAIDAPLGVGYMENFEDYFVAKKGQVIEKKVTIYPENPGSYNVTVNVIDWGYSTNRSSSESFRLTFDENLITVPKTANYDNMNILRYVINLSILAIIGIGLFFGGKKGVKYLGKWFQPPE